MRTLESAEALQRVLDAVPSPVFVKDKKHRFVGVNEALCELVGRSREELLGRSDYDFQPTEQADEFWSVDNLVFRTGETHENEEVITDGTGVVRVIVTRKRRIVLPVDGKEKHFLVGVISDVTRFREAEARSRYRAEHDALTGLANRMRLGEVLRLAIENRRSIETKFALFVIDLDGFKSVNDQYGHSVGDEVLRITAERLAGAVRGGDLVARIGGDEFCIVQMGSDDPGARSGLANRLVQLLAEPVAASRGTVRVSCSIGGASYPSDAISADALLQCADRALYCVKRRGRNGYAAFEKGLLETEPWDIAAELRKALDEGQLSVAFQPVASALSGTLRSFEALARWQHPTRGEISPVIFVPVAETSGLIYRLGEWILMEATAEAARWPWPVQVCINVSPLQMDSADLPQLVRRALERSGLPPERLELEITETALLSRSNHVLDNFTALKALGVTLALDDFGAGWSSLDTLRRFPFDRLKIDQSFVANMQSDTRAAAIVRAVLSLGHALQVPVTAEGVETPGQLAALRNMGCNELQGFLIGRPHWEATHPDPETWQSHHAPGVPCETALKTPIADK